MTGSNLSIFDPIIESLNHPSDISPKVVVYCGLIDVVSSEFFYFRECVPYPGAPSCPVAMFHCSTADVNKSYVMSEFLKPQSKIRVVIATVAFGLGVNIMGIKTVINYGLPFNLEEFVQESGRAGRDGEKV